MDLTRRTVLSAAASALALSVTGCAHTLRSAGQQTASATPTPTSSEPTIGRANPLRVGTAAPPRTLDPAWADDAESHRVTRQVAETLVGVDPDTGAPTPLLATRWTITPDGLQYTFTLRPDVLFHDGTELTAETVVANVERWSRLPEELGAGRLAHMPRLSFDSVFGGYAGEDGCRFDSVEATDETTLVITLTDPVTFLLDALTAPSFAITSPASWEQAQTRMAQTPDPQLPETRVAGTGPYRWAEAGELDEAPQDDRRPLRLEIWDQYWGGRPQMGPVTLQVSPEPRTACAICAVTSWTCSTWSRRTCCVPSCRAVHRSCSATRCPCCTWA